MRTEQVIMSTKANEVTVGKNSRVDISRRYGSSAGGGGGKCAPCTAATSGRCGGNGGSVGDGGGYPGDCRAGTDGGGAGDGGGDGGCGGDSQQSPLEL